MIFDIAEDLLRYFISHLAGERNEHGFGEGITDEFFHDREVVSCERSEVLSLRTESERDGQFEEESDVEVAEVAFDRVQKLDAFLTPLI